MVRLTQFTARLIKLCMLWCIVRFTQYLLQISDRMQDADHVSGAELYLQCDIKQMIEDATHKFTRGSYGYLG